MTLGANLGWVASDRGPKFGFYCYDSHEQRMKYAWATMHCLHNVISNQLIAENIAIKPVKRYTFLENFYIQRYSNVAK